MGYVSGCCFLPTEPVSGNCRDLHGPLANFKLWVMSDVSVTLMVLTQNVYVC